MVSKRICRHGMRSGGFTLIEIVIVVAMIGTLAAIAVPVFTAYADKTKISRAITDIKEMTLKIEEYNVENGTLPTSLADMGYGGKRDPWGNSYKYLKISKATSKASLRKDKNLVPINSDYDLYSKGKDGASQAPLTAAASMDDIVRANNGGYVGLAADY